jgi:hypothetical protein
MEVSGQLHAPTALLPGKEPPVPHWIGDCVGTRAVLDTLVTPVNPLPPFLGTANVSIAESA